MAVRTASKARSQPWMSPIAMVRDMGVLDGQTSAVGRQSPSTRGGDWLILPIRNSYHNRQLLADEAASQAGSASLPAELLVSNRRLSRRSRNLRETPTDLY